MTEKIICDAEDLVAIADAVRASTGSAVNYNVPELSVAAVDAIGNGAGEDVTAETNTYTSLLDDLEAAVDALPDAGSGGGASLETCEVTIENCMTLMYTSVANGEIVPEFLNSKDYDTWTITALKNSMLVCNLYGSANVKTQTGATLIKMSGTQYAAFSVDSSPAHIVFGW